MIREFIIIRMIKILECKKFLICALINRGLFILLSDDDILKIIWFPAFLIKSVKI